MKINWKVRLKNPYFWIGILGVIMSAMGIHPEMLTNWAAVAEKGKELLNNPFLLGNVIIAIIGVMTDHTTKGFCDSKQALGYDKPREEEK